MSSKILALVDALGKPVCFAVLPGRRRETAGVLELMDNLACSAFIAGKAYDADWLRQWLAERGIEAGSRHAKNGNHQPNTVRRSTNGATWSRIQKLKELKRIILRLCKTDESFASIISLAASAIRSR